MCVFSVLARRKREKAEELGTIFVSLGSVKLPLLNGEFKTG